MMGENLLIRLELWCREQHGWRMWLKVAPAAIATGILAVALSDLIRRILG
jgi:hypothetical protein